MDVRWRAQHRLRSTSKVQRHQQTWRNENKMLDNRLPNLILPITDYQNEVLRPLVFCSHTSPFYVFASHTIHSIPETEAHRAMRLRKLKRMAVSADESTLDPCSSDSSAVCSPKKYSSPKRGKAMGGKSPLQSPTKSKVVPSLPSIRDLQATFFPTFLLSTCPKVRKSCIH